MKKTIAVFLFIVMFLSIMPLPALAVTQYKVTLDYDNAKGRVYLNGNVEEPGEYVYNQGDIIQVDIEANNEYEISTVTSGTAINVNAKQYNFQIENINKDVTIAIEFQPVTYTITAAAGEGGTISPDGEIVSDYDSDQQIVITSDYGYRIEKVTVDGEDLEGHYGPSFTYDFRHIRNNHTIHAAFSPIGDGSFHKIIFEPSENGSVDAEGMIDNIVSVQDSFDFTFTITSSPGYGISSVLQNGEDIKRYLVAKNDGTFELTLFEVREDTTIEITFIEEEIKNILCKSFAILDEEANDENDIKSALIREIQYLGYVLDKEKIAVYNVDISDISTKGYGTFEFTIEAAGKSSKLQIGYIVPKYSDIIFKYEGSYKGTAIDEDDKIRIAHWENGENGIFSAPAMDSGTIEFIGTYYFHIEGWMSDDSIDSFGESGVSKLTVTKSFYRVQLHIGNIAENEEETLNWFGFDLIQDDALCVKVDATSAEGTQSTLQWSLNRYAILNSGGYVSVVFFGNDTFEITLPEESIGGISSMSIETGDFQGYTITETDPGKKFEVQFKSDFYDRITINITLNSNEEKQLTVHRVGVDIQKEVYNPDRGPDVNLFHGTQFGTEIDYSDGLYYKVFATYCIPDGGTTAPYGLYISCTFANGTKTSEIITQPCDNPSENINAEDYIDGVFIYDGDAACCDYLIYEAEDATNVPAKICVTVLKGDPFDNDEFEGIFFGSGAGVEWINK